MKHKFKPAKFTKHRGEGLDVCVICDSDYAAYTAIVKLLAREVHDDLRASQEFQKPVNFIEGTSRPASEV